MSDNIDKTYIIFLYDGLSYLYKLKDIENNAAISLANWKDTKYSFIIRLKYIKSLDMNKKDVNTLHEYKENYALRGMMFSDNKFIKKLEEKIKIEEVEYINEIKNTK